MLLRVRAQVGRSGAKCVRVRVMMSGYHWGERCTRARGKTPKITAPRVRRARRTNRARSPAERTAYHDQNAGELPVVAIGCGAPFAQSACVSVCWRNTNVSGQVYPDYARDGGNFI